MQKMDEATEKRILRSLEGAVEMVNLGSTPDDAIYKAASEEGFGPPVVQRMVEAFNTSKTLSWLKQADLQKRAESFALADASKILERMYPTAPASPRENTKQASTYMGRDESMNFNTKKAFVDLPKAEYKEYPRTEGQEFYRWEAKSARLNRELDESKIELLKAKEALLDNVKSAAAYFRTLGHEAFAEVEKRALSEYGDTGKACMDLIYATGKLNEKRASANGQRFIFDRSRKPYAHVAGAVIQAKQAAHWIAKVASAQKAADEHANGFCNFLPEKATILGEVLASGKPFPGSAKSAANCLSDILTKEAIDVGSATLGMLGAVGLSGEPDMKKYETSAINQLRDPVHEAEMSSAKVRAMLNDFLANDEVLSTYPEDKVLSSYNQLANMAPTAAQQPAIMRSLLRRMVQQGGVVEPFETHQLAKIENEISRRGGISEAE